MPVYSEDEQGVAKRNPLLLLLHRVIVHTLYGKEVATKPPMDVLFQN